MINVHKLSNHPLSVLKISQRGLTRGYSMMDISKEELKL
jgi:hypothetical protein